MGPALLIFALGCNGADELAPVTRAAEPAEVARSAPPTTTLDLLLDPNVADGFDFAVGDPDGAGNYIAPNGTTYDGWYVATAFAEPYRLGMHPGEDWNGKGGGDTDLGQPVHAVARGRVVTSADFGAPWGQVIEVEHILVENGQPRRIRSLYAHLAARTAEVGDAVARRQLIGTIGTGDGSFPAHLHLELRETDIIELSPTFWPSSNGWDADDVRRAYLPPTSFIRAHRTTPAPASFERLLIVVKSDWRIYLVERGAVTHTWRVGLGQSPDGPKLKQGDNKTPEGAYRILDRSRGPFTGAYAAYFGVGWLRISYPNPVDAERGFAAGRISASDRDRIVAAERAGTEPPKTTALGGGIGIHGWAGRWPEGDHQAITWGCLSVQNEDLDVLYDLVPSGTPIWITP